MVVSTIFVFTSVRRDKEDVVDRGLVRVEQRSYFPILSVMTGIPHTEDFNMSRVGHMGMCRRDSLPLEKPKTFQRERQNNRRPTRSYFYILVTEPIHKVTRIEAGFLLTTSSTYILT